MKITEEQKAGIIDAASAALTAIGFTHPVLITDVVMVIAAVNADGTKQIMSVNTVSDEPWLRMGMLDADKMVAQAHLASMWTDYSGEEE